MIQTKLQTALFLSFFLLCTLRIAAQPPQFKMQNYIDKYSEEAVHQMVAYKIPASVILAQAIFESRSGTSDLAKRANNHFGIKCHEWMGSSLTKDDDTLNECFRKYEHIEDSYTDHSLFLVNRPRYSDLFKLEITDYRAWCYGLKSLGYATYPTYAEELIRIIEQAQLYELDYSATLDNTITAKTEKPEIIPSKYAPSGFNMTAFSKNGLLWLDERDVLVQSLDMVIERNNVSSSDMAMDDLIPSKYSPADFNMKAFSKNGLLWLDERDVLIQSLDLMIESSDNEISDLAGN